MGRDREGPEGPGRREGLGGLGGPGGLEESGEPEESAGLAAELRALGALGALGRSQAGGGAGASGDGAGAPAGGAAGAGDRCGGASPGGPSGAAGPAGVDVEAVVAGVMERVAGEAVPVAGWRVRVRRWVRGRRRVLLAGFAAVLVGLVVAPPVRAGVASLFDFGGVAVRVTPSAAPSGPGTPSPGAPAPGAVPGCGALSPDAAARRAGFRPPVPRELGAPDAAGVSADGRMVSLCWAAGDGSGGGGAVRLDAFRGTLDPLVGKTSSVPPEWEQAGTGTALWFPVPHRLELLLHEPGGSTYNRQIRTAGPTLLWQGPDGLTLRLEGVPGKERALRIADSAS